MCDEDIYIFFKFNVIIFNLNLSIVSKVTGEWIFKKLKFRILKRSKCVQEIYLYRESANF